MPETIVRFRRDVKPLVYSKSPFSSPFTKGGKRGIFTCPTPVASGPMPVVFLALDPRFSDVYSGPFFSLWIFIAVSMSFETIMPGSIPCSAACSKKNEEGAMPDDELDR